MVALFLAILCGILLGTISGLIPGIHSNTIASLLSTLPLQAEFFPYIVAAVLGAHLIFSFFPSIFLSIPDDAVAASVLPGHKMAIQGKGKEALEICIFSALIAALASALLFPAATWVLPALYSLVEPNLAPILVIASAFLLLSEKGADKIIFAAGVFLLSGMLGLATARLGISDPLFPAFSGLFASSGILLSLASNQWPAKQKEAKTKIDFLGFVALGVAFGMLSDLLPGFAAPAQIAIFASLLLQPSSPKQFLALIAAIAASHSIFSFAALSSIGKAREGSVAIMQQVAHLEPAQLPSLVGTVLLSAGISGLALVLASRMISGLEKLGSKTFGILVLAYLIGAVAIISGIAGLIVFATATAIGLIPPLLGVRRTHVMGLIIVPSIAFAI